MQDHVAEISNYFHRSITPKTYTDETTKDSWESGQYTVEVRTSQGDADIVIQFYQLILIDVM